MFRCNECDGYFRQPKTGPEYEELCPACGSDNFEKLTECDCGLDVESEDCVKTSKGEIVCKYCAFDFLKELIDSGEL